MENNSLFPLKYRIRKTDELVEIVAWETTEKGARNENDWVSYIDASGVEHIKEHFTLEWDFVIQTPFEKGFFDAIKPDLPTFDPWEARRYELTKDFIMKGYTLASALEKADAIISALKKSPEATEKEDSYENIGIGEIVKVEVDGPEPLKKFEITDLKDIVGFLGDDGRWKLGDKAKIYIKKYEPKKGDCRRVSP